MLLTSFVWRDAKLQTSRGFPSLIRTASPPKYIARRLPTKARALASVLVVCVAAHANTILFAWIVLIVADVAEAMAIDAIGNVACALGICNCCKESDEDDSRKHYDRNDKDRLQSALERFRSSR